jgi:hypothetical protein
MKARLARASLLLLAAAHPGCNQALLTAPPGAILQIFANPTFIAANGDVSVISVLVIEPAGTPVPDGTVVQFFTNLGRIDEQGRTNDGVARVNLVSDRRSGTATVTAVSGGDGASETTVDVEIGSSSARPARVFVTADPPRIVSPRFTTIVATVFDEDGNPVANVPVVFTVLSDTGDATESMQSGSAAIFTDNNGQARDELLTSYPPDEPTKSVEVMATLLAGTEISDSTTVQIN